MEELQDQGRELIARRKRVKFSECVVYNDYSVNVLNDNPIPHLKRSVFLSSPPHQDGDQEAEVASFLTSFSDSSVGSVAYFSPQPAQGVE